MIRYLTPGHSDTLISPDQRGLLMPAAVTEENMPDCLGALGSFGHRLIEAQCVEVQGPGCWHIW